MSVSSNANCPSQEIRIVLGVWGLEGRRREGWRVEGGEGWRVKGGGFRGEREGG